MWEIATSRFCFHAFSNICHSAYFCSKFCISKTIRKVEMYQSEYNGQVILLEHIAITNIQVFV